MTVFGLIAVVLLATLGYLAATRIVTPVRQLQEAAQSIGRGELRQSIQIKTGDELETLAEEFNRMNKQLEVAFAGLTDQVTMKTQEVQYLQRSTDQILDAVPTPILIVDDQDFDHYVAVGISADNGTPTHYLPAMVFVFSFNTNELHRVSTPNAGLVDGSVIRDPLLPSSMMTSPSE